MPELPEVETVRSGLERILRGRRFVRVEQRRKDLRFPLPEGFAARLTGRRVLSLGRRAKYLLVRLDKREVLELFDGYVHNDVSRRDFLARAAKYAKEGGAVRRALDMIDGVYEQARRHPESLEMAFTSDDIRRIHKTGKIAVANIELA